MLKRPTVLILGAGASAEYHFPVGYSLYQSICRGEVGTPPLPPHQEHLKQDADRRFRDFCTQLTQSGQLSVDAFLETCPDLMDIGKRAIACGLIPYEVENDLFFPQSYAWGPGPRWYQLLLAELGNNFDTLAENRLSVLTFNYDRSFEHFLVVALGAKYNLPRSRTWQQVQRIPIHHLYGSLGAYEPDGRIGRAYTNEITFQSVQECVDSIHLLREGTEHDEVFASAHKILQGAELVVILGFRFDQTNLERLKIDLVPTGAQICGSGFGMTERERDRAKTIIGRPIEFGAEDEGNSAFLRNHVTLN